MRTVKFTDSYWDIVVFGETRAMAWDRHYEYYLNKLNEPQLKPEVRVIFAQELRHCEDVLKRRFLK